ncbi:SO_0444 family Cu/Zn efflux transporter [Nitratifractor sp.]
MRNIIFDYLESFWQLLSSIAPYILVGIFLAGAMKLLIREEWIERQLGDGTIRGSLKAILFGIPLPLCSCSVIPFATALRKAGASRSATLSFLIATPITGVDSIAATYGVLGWFFTLYRVVTSILIALLAGVLSLLFDREEKIREVVSAPTEPSPQVFTMGAPGPQGQGATFTPLRVDTPPAGEETSCCGSSCCEENGAAEKNWQGRLWSESVYRIFGDFARALLIGIALGALLVTFMPESLEQYLSDNLWLNYLIVLLIAAPLYICATSSIPLGVALLIGGFSPGAVFLFLTAGPASSTVTMSVVRKVLGTRSLVIYLVSVLSGTLLFGWMLDTLFASQALEMGQTVHEMERPGFVGQVSAVLLLMLSWKVLFQKKRSSGCCG